MYGGHNKCSKCEGKHCGETSKNSYGILTTEYCKVWESDQRP